MDLKLVVAFAQFYFAFIFLLDTTATSISVPLPVEDAMPGDRGLGYKKKPKGKAAARPTWRPWIDPDHESPSASNKLDPDGYFPDDYYDDYDSEIEGTRRNILVHHTFEERMRTYVKLMTESAKNSAVAKANIDVLSDAAKNVKPMETTDQKKANRKAARKAQKSIQRSIDVEVDDAIDSLL